MTTLQIVSVNYFGADVLGELVRSLLEQTRPDWELVIVDNSESDIEACKLAQFGERDPRVTVAVASSNLGYFGGAQWWLGQRQVRADWVAVCNADVMLADDNFVATLAALQGSAAIVAPDVTALPSGHPQNPHLETRPSVRHMLLRRLALSTRLSAWAAKRVAEARKNSRSAMAKLGVAQKIYAPHGSFILFRRGFFDQGGSLEHPPFLYGEEITVAERAWRLGQGVRYEPRLKVVHNEHQATKNASKRVFLAQREAAAYAHVLIRQVAPGAASNASLVDPSARSRE